MLASAKNGISSYELARSIGVKQESAWHMMHRIRTAMEVGSVEKMKGQVAVDETFIGGKAKNMHGERKQEMRAKGFPKSVVFGMREKGGDVRTVVVADTKKETLQAEIREHIAEDTEVVTDSWVGYEGLSEDYSHEIVDHKRGQYVNENGYTTNSVENYWTILKRCYHGTYIHLSPQHLSRYLSEEDFRFNSRKMKDGDRFNKVLSQMHGKRLTYDELTTSHLQYIMPR
jgi:transposase-like protein